jgi:hypothetical protein
MKKAWKHALAGALLLVVAAAPVAAEEPSTKGLEERVAALEKVWKGMEMKGDFRLRYQGDDFADEATAKTRHRGRFRLRVGVERKEVLPGLKVGLRLASGETNDATSTNQSFDDHFNRKNVWIDQAYVLYTPPSNPDLTLGGGKVANPFLSTDIVWDSDVNPEGLYASWATGPKGSRFSLVPAFLVVEEESGSRHDTYAGAVQARYDLGSGPADFTAAVAYYDYQQVEESQLATSSNARGNTISGAFLTARDFDILDAYLRIRLKGLPLPLEIVGNYVKNVGEDAPPPDSGLDTAFGAGVKAGKAGTAGDWSLSYMYKSIEANAVVGFFADSDFGFANKKGHVVRAGYTIHKNVQFDLAGFSVKQKDPVGGSPVNPNNEFKLVQVDLVFKF